MNGYLYTGAASRPGGSKPLVRGKDGTLQEPFPPVRISLGIS